MNPHTILAGVSVLCFVFAITVSTLIAYTNPTNPLGLIVLASALFASAGLAGLLSITWYLVHRAVSRVTSVAKKAGINSERGSKNSKRNIRFFASEVPRRFLFHTIGDHRGRKRPNRSQNCELGTSMES